MGVFGLLLLLLLAATTAKSGSSSSSCPSECNPKLDLLPECCKYKFRCSSPMPELLTFVRKNYDVTETFNERYSDRLFCNMQTIVVEGNSLRNLNFLAFFPNITNLSLTWTELRYISPGSFVHSRSLEKLSLSHNELFSLDGVLDPLKNLTHLNISHNKLRRIDSDWFSNLVKLTELDISSNGIVLIPPDTLQPLTSLSVFKLAENPLINDDLSLLLGTGRRLEVVDASATGLSRIPTTLTRSVRSLVLAGNQLTSVSSGDFDSYPLLRLLDLSHNTLILIEEDALGRLENLEQLFLSSNILHEIPTSLPNGLRHLDLSQNVILEVKLNDLQGLGELVSLDLSGNVIDSLIGGFLGHVPKLQKLDISNNPIKELPPDILKGPKSLTHLKMSGLVFLEVKQNQNHDTAFPILALERLEYLDISSSPALAAQLLDDAAALKACKSLEELDLSYANVSDIRHDFAFVLPRLRRLNLVGNAWNCSDHQRWLGDWMRSHAMSNYSAVCKSPAEMKGKFLTNMPRDSTRASKTTEEPKTDRDYVSKVKDKNDGVLEVTAKTKFSKNDKVPEQSENNDSVKSPTVVKEKVVPLSSERTEKEGSSYDNTASTFTVRPKFTPEKKMVSVRSFTLVDRKIEILSSNSTGKDEWSTKSPSRVANVTESISHTADLYLTTKDPRIINRTDPATITTSTMGTLTWKTKSQEMHVETEEKLTTQKNESTMSQSQGHSFQAPDQEATTPKLPTVIDGSKNKGDVKSVSTMSKENGIPTTSEFPMKTNSTSTETTPSTETKM
ncbi:hypothetical protein QAD02_010611, partial [Eretmocerus hayati]